MNTEVSNAGADAGSIINPTLNFSALGLAQPILRAIADAGYTTPTPIQAKAIPLVLSGGDLLAGAQTGTGKTAGFTPVSYTHLDVYKRQPSQTHGRRHQQPRGRLKTHSNW